MYVHNFLKIDIINYLNKKNSFFYVTSSICGNSPIIAQRALSSLLVIRESSSFKMRMQVKGLSFQHGQ